MEILNNIVFIYFIISFGIAMYHKEKFIKTPLKMMLLLLFFLMLVEIIPHINTYFTVPIKTNIVFNMVMPIQYNMLSIMFYQLLRNKKILLIQLGLFNLFFLSQMLSERLNEFNIYILGVGTIGILGMIILLNYTILLTEFDTFTFSDLRFWISIGFFVFYFVGFPILLIMKFSTWYTTSLHTILYLLNIIYLSLFNIGFILCKKQNYPLLSSY